MESAAGDGGYFSGSGHSRERVVSCSVKSSAVKSS